MFFSRNMTSAVSTDPFKKRALTLEIFLLLAGGLNAAAALAQTVPTPGTVLETVRPNLPIAPAPKLEKPLSLTPSVEAGNQDPNAPRTQVAAFRITGNLVIDTSTLTGLIAEYAGKPYNLYELQKVTRVISDYYHSKGYPVARAVVPAQKIEGGTLTLEVIEGRIEKAHFTGNKLYSDTLLSRWTKPLNGKPVQVEPLEERMLAINDLPGVKAQAVLTPGSEYGTTVLDVQVKEKPIDGQISFNNSGRREVGEYRVDGSVNLNNPFGIGDQLGFRTSYSERGLIKMLGANYSLPLNIEGTRLAVNYTAVDYGIGGDLGNLDINGKSNLGGVTVIHPFIRKQSENLFGTFGIRYFNGKQFMSDTPITKNSVLVAEAGIAWNHIDPQFNVTSAGVRISSNFRSSLDNEWDHSQKLKLDGEISHLFHMTKVWDLKLSASGQVSSQALADSEKFSLGGTNSVRGYPSADVRGDRGVFASVEVRYRPTFISMPSYFSVFADGGYTARRNPTAGTPYSSTINSAGIGYNFFPTPSVIAEIAAAVPTSRLDPSDSRKGGRIWFNLTTTF